MSEEKCKEIDPAEYFEGTYLGELTFVSLQTYTDRIRAERDAEIRERLKEVTRTVNGLKDTPFRLIDSDGVECRCFYGHMHYALERSSDILKLFSEAKGE